MATQSRATPHYPRVDEDPEKALISLVYAASSLETAVVRLLEACPELIGEALDSGGVEQLWLSSQVVRAWRQHLELNKSTMVT